MEQRPAESSPAFSFVRTPRQIGAGDAPRSRMKPSFKPGERMQVRAMRLSVQLLYKDFLLHYEREPEELLNVYENSPSIRHSWLDKASVSR
jgi:hypothetical protein